MPNPLSTFKGTVKQISPECLTEQGKTLVRVCAPMFLPLTEEQRQQVFESRRSNLDPLVTHFLVPTHRFRRFSGDHFTDDGTRLSAGNYYSVCLNDSGLDYGTLVNEMNAYRSSDVGFYSMFIDGLDPDARRLNVAPTPQPVVLVPDAVGLLQALPKDAPAELVESVSRSASQHSSFGMLLGILVSPARIEGVVDLREREAQEWFFKRYVTSGPLPTRARRFVDILPELLQPPLGGSTGSNIRLQTIGADLRRLGVNGLIYPSARSDVGVEYKDGQVHRSKGWNLVTYGGSLPRDVLTVDLGGWETAFWGGVRLEERTTDAESDEGWWVVGLELLQQLRYERALKDKGISLPGR